MRTIPAAALALVAAGVVHAAPASSQRPERISPSITLQQYADPVERRDFSRLHIQSTDETGDDAGVVIQCFGPRRVMWVEYDPPAAQPRSLVWHADGAAPDTLLLPAQPRMRAYGGPGLWLVLYRPRDMVFVPDSVIPRWTDAARGASGLSVRVEGRDGPREARFDLTDLARGLDPLACLRAPVDGDAPRAPGSAAEPYWDPEQLDEVPTPADSAGTAHALRRDVPSSGIAARLHGSVFATLSISAAGRVEVVRFPSERGEVAALARFLESVRFHPGRRDGQPVPSRISVEIQVADP